MSLLAGASPRVEFSYNADLRPTSWFHVGALFLPGMLIGAARGAFGVALELYVDLNASTALFAPQPRRSLAARASATSLRRLRPGPSPTRPQALTALR